MKVIFYITVLTSFLITNLHALPSDLLSKKVDEIKSDTSNKVEKYFTNYSEYVFNLIPGNGITEVSVDLRENYKPDFSILLTREIKKLNNGNYFTQFSLFKSEYLNDERYTGNLGFGTRRLSDDKTILGGLNFFLDYDDEENARGSICLLYTSDAADEP